MSLTLSESKDAILSSGFSVKSSTVKLIEFESNTTDQMLYLYKQQGFPDHADVIVHPDTNTIALFAIPGIEPNRRVTYRFGSNMGAFPKRKNRGDAPEHYGRALYAFSELALAALCIEYKL